jgi:SAM-dependent methyltransferase
VAHADFRKARPGDESAVRPDSTVRFTGRAEAYARHRPGYPSGMVEIVERETGLGPAAVVADVGSGTGLSSAPFLRRGCVVMGVEPNEAMRQAAESLFGEQPRFRSVAGTAEATTLPDRSVDLVVACQAFHWFDRVEVRREFSRILRPPGRLALVWNSRRTDSTPFLRDFEAFLVEYAIDYREVNHRLLDSEAVAPAFHRGSFAYHTLDNEQSLDWQGLVGRVLSSSYMPAAGHPRHEAMLDALGPLFARHQQQGRVIVEYDTEIYAGRLAAR